jgi:hypothetical protein
LKQSVTELDEVLPFGFNQKAAHDHWILRATSWRISAARESGDKAKAVELLKWVQAADCTKNQKARFIQAWSFLLNPGNTNN